MIKADFNGRLWRIPIFKLCLILMMSCTIGATVHANDYDDAPNGSLACDGLVNVTLDPNTCDALITLEMILQGAPDLANYSYTLTIEGPAPSTATMGPAADILIDAKGEYVVTVTSVALVADADGTFETNNCWGKLNVEDKTGPVITPAVAGLPADDPATPDVDESCPCNAAAPCPVSSLCTDINSLFTAGSGITMPTATDNCSDVVTTVFAFTNGSTVNGLDMCDVTVITGKWIFKDECGNESESCEYHYLLEPLTLADANIDCPAPTLLLPCGTGTSPAEIYQYWYDFTYNHLVQDALDALLLTDPHATIADIPQADLNAFAAQANDDADHLAYPLLDGEILEEGTYCNFAVVFEDEFIPVCGTDCSNSDKIIRTWKIFNWCAAGSDPIECVQIIDAHDADGPLIEANDHTVTVDPWGCYADFYMPEPVSLHDHCSDYVSYSVSGPAGASVSYEAGLGWHVTNVAPGIHTFYYNGFDCCGNTTSVPVTLTVVDNTQPIAVAKQDIVISLVNIQNGTDGSTGVAKLYAASIDNGSFDGCTDVHLEIRRDVDYCSREGNDTYNDDDHLFDNDDDTDQGAFVTFCCTDIAENGVDENGDGIFDYALLKVWLRVWDDGDVDGTYGSAGDNYNEAWGYVRVEDKASPDILCPADITVDCATDPFDFDVVGEGSALNACGSASANYEDMVTDLDGCGAGEIVRKWYIDGRPDINCVQTITILPSDNGAVAVWFPEDVTTDCTDDLSDEEPTWTTDNPCDLLAWTVDVDTFYLEEGACYKIIKHWSVINWCSDDPYDPLGGGVWSDHQVIKVIDDDAPYFTDCPDNLVLEADDYDDADQDGIICENNAVMLTAVADDAGNCASPYLRWNIEIDLESDGWVEYVFSSSLPNTDPYYVAPTLTGTQIKITLPEGVRGGMFSHTVTWNVSDGCGNVGSCNSTFMVVDQKPPTPYCVNLSTALMENGQVELWACDFNLGSFDNCTPASKLRYTFSATPPQDDPAYNEATFCSARVFTCDDLAAQSPFPVTMYVWDEKDNYDFCIVNLTLVDNQSNCDGDPARANIMGNVYTELGEKIEDVRVDLVSALPESPVDQMTNTDGSYAFMNNVMYVDYEVSGLKNDDYLNGVSTLDLVLIQRHVIGIQYLNSSYKLIAADVNNDEKVSSIDLIELRKLILGIHNEYPNNDSWRFVATDQTLDATNPWPFVEFISIDDLDHDMTQQDFVGVKIGDVNATAIVNLTGTDVDNRSNETITFDINDQNFRSGDVVEVSFSSEDFNDVYGYQFTMNTKGLEFISAQSAALNIDNSNVAVIGDQLTMSWNNLESVTTDEKLFSLQFRANANASIQQTLDINSSITNAEAYIGNNLEIVNIDLRGLGDNAFKLYQNVPNPFSEMTTIAFELPEAGDAQISIFDVTGKVLNVINGNYPQGYNEVELNANSMNASGILYYELKSGNYTSTQKMVVLK